MLKVRAPVTTLVELLLLYHAKNYNMSLFLFFVYGERDNQKLIKAPHCQYHTLTI